jgi:hypothetical protein
MIIFLNTSIDATRGIPGVPSREGGPPPPTCAIKLSCPNDPFDPPVTALAIIAL